MRPTLGRRVFFFSRRRPCARLVLFIDFKMVGKKDLCLRLSLFLSRELNKIHIYWRASWVRDVVGELINASTQVEDKHYLRCTARAGNCVGKNMQ